jgi:hypothetical protein
MSLAFEAIYPKIYPVAYEYFEQGMERYHVAGKIFHQFGKEWNIPKNKIHIMAIDLSISCAENDFINKLEKGTSGRNAEDKKIARLLHLDEKEC